MVKTKLLCITNNPISLNNANGKFVRNYLYSFREDELCNFFITNEEGAKNISSFNITNNEAFKKTVSFGFYKKKNKKLSNNGLIKNTSSPLKHILRYFIWNLGLWKSSNFNKWLRQNEPTHIILAIADNPYLIKFAVKLSKKLSIPLINIIGENYSIKCYDYLSKKNKMSLTYKIFKKILKRHTTNAILFAKENIFNSEEIMNEYINEYGKIKSIKLYPPADNISTKRVKIEKNSVLYAGNLGLGRDMALIEFAKALYVFDPKKVIYVYSKIDKSIAEKIAKEKNIKYMGFITNNQLNKKIMSSELLIHVEHKSPYNLIDLKTAFSTKIANNIFYGNKFLIYSPKTLAQTEFFIKYLPNNVATNVNEIFEKLQILYKSQQKVSTDVLDLFDIKITSEIVRKLILA